MQVTETDPPVLPLQRLEEVVVISVVWNCPALTQVATAAVLLPGGNEIPLPEIWLGITPARWDLSPAVVAAETTALILCQEAS